MATTAPSSLKESHAQLHLMTTTRLPAELPMVGHFIGNQFRLPQPGKTFITYNPANNQPIARVAEGDAQEIDAAVSAARSAFQSGIWSKLKPAERAQALFEIADQLERRSQEIAEREVTDVGMPIAQARSQAARSAENFRFYARYIQNLSGESYQVGDEFINYTIRKPLGVIGLIMPWNTPLMLTTWRLAPCLAAGNASVLKPAEWSPLSANLLSEIVQAAGLPEGVFNLVHGFGETAGEALVKHPHVNGLCFTGETATGKIILANAAQTLKRTSVELGGKSPVVVFADADLDRALDATVFGVFSLNGERCTAGSRLLVQRSIYDRFVAAVAERAKRVKVGDPAQPKTELGPLISREHHERVLGMIDRALSQGGRLLAGGKRPEHLPEGNYIEATVIADVMPDREIFQDEVFGPVIVATPFEDEAEALQLANDVRYGLAAYVWTRDIARGHRLAHQVDSGLVWINSHNVRDLRTPFGGVKESGLGREGGHFAFDFYCELQTVHVAMGNHHIPKFGQ